MFVLALDVLPAPESLSADAQAGLIEDLVVVENARRRILLAQIVHFDRTQAWKQDGVHSMTDWLSYRFGMLRRTADELVRVAHALDMLPAIAEAYADGRISWDKVVALASFATPDEDAWLAEVAQTHTPFQIEHIAKWRRRITREETDRAYDARYLRCGPHRDGSYRINGRLPAAEGAVVAKAIERTAEQLPPDDEGHYGPARHRNADALVEICSARLADDADADRATVLVHVGAEALNHINGTAELEEGTTIAAETARRLACDGRIQLVVDGRDGEPLGIGRATRSVPPWLLRQIRRRDRGCRFAECGRTRGLHAHHVVHWAHGGRTDLDNLVLLCPRHHRKVHEERWRLVLDGRGRVRTVRPDGRPLNSWPFALRPDLRELLDASRLARAPAV